MISQIAAENQVPVIAGLAALLTACVALYVRRQNSRDAARITFRAAFATELSILRELKINETGQVFDVLRAAYPKHENAYIDYSNSLDRFRQIILRRRWQQYRGPLPEAPEIPTEDKRYRLAHLIGSDIDNEESKRMHTISLLTKLCA